mgnify:CR=1 FL=1
MRAVEPMLPRLTLDGALAVSAVTTRLIEELFRHNIRLKDIATTQSSLEDIFVDLVRPGR